MVIAAELRNRIKESNYVVKVKIETLQKWLIRSYSTFQTQYASAVLTIEELPEVI